jgi:hypothetical protein
MALRVFIERSFSDLTIDNVETYGSTNDYWYFDVVDGPKWFVRKDTAREVRVSVVPSPEAKAAHAELESEIIGRRP